MASIRKPSKSFRVKVTAFQWPGASCGRRWRHLAANANSPAQDYPEDPKDDAEKKIQEKYKKAAALHLAAPF